MNYSVVFYGSIVVATANILVQLLQHIGMGKT